MRPRKAQEARKSNKKPAFYAKTVFYTPPRHAIIKVYQMHTVLEDIEMRISRLSPSLVIQIISRGIPLSSAFPEQQRVLVGSTVFIFFDGESCDGKIKTGTTTATPQQHREAKSVFNITRSISA